MDPLRRGQIMVIKRSYDRLDHKSCKMKTVASNYGIKSEIPDDSPIWETMYT